MFDTIVRKMSHIPVGEKLVEIIVGEKFRELFVLPFGMENIRRSSNVREGILIRIILKIVLRAEEFGNIVVLIFLKSDS